LIYNIKESEDMHDTTQTNIRNKYLRKGQNITITTPTPNKKFDSRTTCTNIGYNFLM